MGTCGRGWGHVTRARAYGRGCGRNMSQGLGSCGRGWEHVAGYGGMWQGVGACGRGSGLWHGHRHVAGVGTCGRMWGHVAGFGACGRGGGRVWGHVAGGMSYVVGVCGMGQAYGIDGDMW